MENQDEIGTVTDVTEIARGTKKRQTAFKLKLADLHSSHIENGIVEIGNKKVSRVNIIANVIDKFISEGERRFASLTIDDASSQIRVKTFGDDLEKFNNVEIGDTILVIGNTRFFNNELYILPEIVRKLPIEWLLVRKLELGNKDTSEVQIEKIEGINLRQQIYTILKKSEEGVDIDKIIMELKAPVEEINSVVTKMIEEAEVYEPKPGRIRIL
ncbi:hypothetical protein HZA33_04560 [Candidatus Pacearchaeota archaeon]|nr:hypothetical protein [Candidatus Pacearchaeota archaeon]